MRIFLENLSKSYKDADHRLTVIEGVQHEFVSGSSNSIVGRSGVGKSTLLHLLAGLDTPDSGRVICGDSDLGGFSPDELASFRGRNIGVVFQFHHLLPEFSALENAAMPLTIAGVSDEEACARARTVLERMGLGARVEHLPSQLSGGEQQRVAIARALVASPKILLADEPTGNLDMHSARDVQGLLFEAHREFGATLVLVTHSQDLARSTENMF